jgi:hypothetical protein
MATVLFVPKIFIALSLKQSSALMTNLRASKFVAVVTQKHNQQALSRSTAGTTLADIQPGTIAENGCFAMKK